MQNFNHDSSFSSFKKNDTYGYPKGHIIRVEADLSQINLVIKNTTIKTVMINLDDAEKLLNSGINSSYFGPKKLVITTSTISDLNLSKYFLEKEASIVIDFAPNFHIPRDRPVYLSQNEKERLWNIQAQVEETIELRELLNQTSIKLIPLLKGVNREEQLSSYIPLKNEGFKAFSYYSVQYFGKGRGNLSNYLIKDLWGISNLPDIQYIMLVGIESERILRRLPPEIKAFAGLRFVRENCWKTKEMKDKKQANLDQFFSWRK